MIKLILTNHENTNLYCHYCKRKILIDEKFLTVIERIYNDEDVEHYYHIGCEVDNEWVEIF